MDYQDYLPFAYGSAEILFTFAFYFLVAGLLLAVLSVLFKPKVKKVAPEVNQAESANVNEYLDKMLENAAFQIHKLAADPLSLPNADKNFQKDLIFLKVSGGLQTKRGKLKGLSTIHRAGDATFFLETLTLVNIRATLGINNIQIGSNAKAWLGRFILDFFIGAQVKHVTFSLELKLPLFGRRKPKAENLVIEELGAINLDVKNLGFLSRPLQGLGYYICNFNKGMLKRKVAPHVESAINNALENIKFPGLLKLIMLGPDPTPADDSDPTPIEKDS